MADCECTARIRGWKQRSGREGTSLSNLMWAGTTYFSSSSSVRIDYPPRKEDCFFLPELCCQRERSSAFVDPRITFTAAAFPVDVELSVVVELDRFSREETELPVVFFGEAHDLLVVTKRCARCLVSDMDAGIGASEYVPQSGER